MKELHTALFVAPTGIGKTHLVLILLENEYRNYFDFIVIICPTLRYNSTYKSRGWVWNDSDVIPIEPGNQLHYLIEKISNLLAGPTLRYNSTYKSRGWVWNDPDVIPIEPGNQLHYLIEKISNLLAGSTTLFLINDIIADEEIHRSTPL